jgi:D-sedoheptulose 7-phosphate isomerase
MEKKKLVISELEESIAVKKIIAEKLAGIIAEAAGKIAASFKSGGKLFLIGNGGSAADAQHIAAEFIGHFKKERRALPAIALTTDTSILTALANDDGYDTVFSRQLEALAAPRDVLLAFTTSGASPNVLKAAKTARSKNMSVIALTGARPSTDLENVADLSIAIPSGNTQRIQEAHITIGHIICGLVEKSLFKQ